MNEASIIFSSFLAGILMFLAPCTLPLVPAYLGLLSGLSAKELHDPEKVKYLRWRVFRNALFYVIGFSLVFVIFGSGISFLILKSGGVARLWIQRVAGILVILFGLSLIGIISPERFFGFLNRLRINIRVERFRKIDERLGAFLGGAAFASGWTPCVGPILGTVLLLAGTRESLSQGVFLLGIFSLGLAIPFLLVALAFGSAVGVVRNLSRYFRAISAVGGIFLIFVGLVLITNNFPLLIKYGYQLFRGINYEKLLEFL